MAFDIYGNYLKPGYCEVHADVHESYPCRICMDDEQKDAHYRDLYEQEKRQYFELLEQEKFEQIKEVKE